MTALPDLQTLLTVYNLPPGFYVERVRPNIFDVSSSNGHYILRLFPYGTSLDGQRYQHWLLMALEKRVQGILLPTPVRNRDGATFYKADNGATWVLYNHLKGDPVLPNDPDHAYAAGGALGDIHRAMATLQPLYNPDFPDYDLEHRTLPHTRGTLPEEPWELGLQDTRESHHRLTRFHELALRFMEPPELPNEEIIWQIIHGGFVDTNLMYDGDAVVGVLDFETAHPDYRVREFTDTLMWLATDRSAFFWAIARAFAESYQETLSLTSPEIDLIPYFIVARQVDEVLEYAAGKQPVHAAQALRQQEEISAWLESEQSRLMALMRGIFLGE